MTARVRDCRVETDAVVFDDDARPAGRDNYRDADRGRGNVAGNVVNASSPTRYMAISISGGRRTFVRPSAATSTVTSPRR